MGLADPTDRARVLVVDDSKVIRRILRTYLLNEFDAEVTEASDGAAGLVLAGEERYDLICADVEMPAMSGLDFCREVHREGPNRSTPVVIISTRDSEADIEAGFAAGAAAYIPKPFTQAQLRRVVEDVWRTQANVAGRVILVVDDSAPIREMVCQGLVEAGLRTVCAVDGVEAVTCLEEHSIDLILSDMEMPRLDGLGLLEACRQHSAWATIPFLFMSTVSEQEAVRAMLTHGAVGYLHKPFSIDHLVVLVEKYLSDHFLSLLRERRRLQQEREMLMATIMGLAQALDARDPYTRAHSERVARIACVLAESVGLSELDVNQVRTAGRLHDIGKIGICDAVLLKPGPLSDEERATIETHPVIAAEILEPIGTLEGILPLVRHHHERYDGGGYPDGVVGEDIPLGARLLAVADVFHALVSNRPYRNAMPVEDALSIIREGRGTQFCPRCADGFLALADEGGSSWERILQEAVGAV